MASPQPHRTPEEGQQSHSYLLAIFQRLPPEWGSCLSVSKRSPSAGRPVAAPDTAGLLARAQRPHVCNSLRGSVFHLWESRSGERECGEDVFIWILANLIMAFQVFLKKTYLFLKKSLGNEQTIREHQNIFILNMWISSYVKEGSWTRYF